MVVYPKYEILKEKKIDMLMLFFCHIIKMRSCDTKTGAENSEISFSITRTNNIILHILYKFKL